MSDSQIVVLGSVTPPGRLHHALSATVERLRARGGTATLIDLATLDLPFADGRPVEALPEGAQRAIALVQGSSSVILASPVYRATITGALKNFLDLLPIEALQGKPVGVVAMGATPHHFLGVASHVRDIAAWFGALVAPTDVYLTSADFADGELGAAPAQQLDELLDALQALETIASTGTALGPTPFAARRH